MINKIQVINALSTGQFVCNHANRLTRIRKAADNNQMSRDCRWTTVGRIVFNSPLKAAAVPGTVKRGISLRQSSKPDRNMAAEIGCREDSIDGSLAILILTEHGLIQHCNRRGAELLGRSPASLLWKPVSAVLPQLAEMTLISNDEINPRLRFLARIGHLFEVLGPRGIHLKCELFFIYKEYHGHCYLQVIMCPRETDARHLPYVGER